MAARYIAVVSHFPAAMTEPLGRLSVSSGLNRVFFTQNLAVFANSDALVTSIPGNSGIVIGSVFTREDEPRPVRKFDDGAVSKIGATRGQHLIESYWGSYVALLDCAGEVYAIREPSGAMQCYYYSTNDVTYIFSDVETLIQAGLYEPEIDWAFVAGHIFHFDLRTCQTALAGVTELLGGFRLSLSRSHNEVTSAWTPWAHTEPDPTLNNEDAEEALRATVRGCVRAKASSYNNILLGVSGGLDSSVIAASLVGHATPCTAFTMATHDPDGDERHYSRMLRDHLGFDMIEGYHEPDDVDVLCSTSSHLPRPIGFNFGQSERLKRNQISAGTNIDAHFTGIGGDNVFCMLQSASPLSDRLQYEGIGPGAWATALDICRLTGCTIWKAIGVAARHAMSPRRNYKWIGEGRFLNPNAVISPDEKMSHPWLTVPKGALVGKVAHVAMLVRIQGTLDGYPLREPIQLVTPLLSQPIIEFALRYPTWKWVSGGVNRALVRRAFSDALPAALINRRSKAGPNSFCASVVERNRTTIHEHLAYGELARRGLVDMESIGGVLEGEGPIRNQDHLSLGTLAEAEAWTQAWLARRSQPNSRGAVCPRE